jgi:hypothetical protein
VFVYRFSYPHVPSQATASILSNREHPLHLLIRRRHAHELPRDQLNMWVHAPKWHSKKVVRDHQVRRVRQAMVLALKARGVRRDGKMLDDGRPFVVGSLHLRVLERAMRSSFEELMSYCSTLVDRIVRRSREATAAMKDDTKD